MVGLHLRQEIRKLLVHEIEWKSEDSWKRQTVNQTYEQVLKS